jgi:pimeloyl-ACP methyl ester carboxylesterase
MGAKIAMAVALRQGQRESKIPPKTIANLIPVDNAPVDAALHGGFGKYMQGMRRIEDSAVTSLDAADKILQEYEESLPVRQFLLTNLIRDTEDTENKNKRKWQVPLKYLQPALNGMGDFPFSDPDSVRWEGPALFVRGTKSSYVADEMLPTIGRFFPGFRVVDVEAGHWVISEKPEEFREGELLFPFAYIRKSSTRQRLLKLTCPPPFSRGRLFAGQGLSRCTTERDFFEKGRTRILKSFGLQITWRKRTLEA